MYIVSVAHDTQHAWYSSFHALTNVPLSFGCLGIRLPYDSIHTRCLHSHRTGDRSDSARDSSTSEALDGDSKDNVRVDIGHHFTGGGSNADDGNSSASSEQHETDEESAVQSVAPRGTSRGQSQVVSQAVDAPVPVAQPVSRRMRRARRGDAADDFIANRTRARSGRLFFHRAGGVRATRSRVRAGEACLVAGIR